MQTNQTSNTSNLLLGAWRCIVENVDHPEGLMMAQVRVIGLWDDMEVALLPWAEYMTPVGARPGDGDFKPAQKGDVVWCQFDRGDSRYPIIQGSAYTAPAQVPSLPPEAFAGADSYEHKRTPSQPVPDKARYHRDRVSTQFEFTIERTETGAMRATHRRTGTAFEITKDGQLVIHGEEDAFYSCEKDRLDEVALTMKLTVGKQIHIESREANVKVNAATQCTVDAPKIHLNGGAPIVTTAHICHWTGSPHGDGSSTCTAGK